MIQALSGQGLSYRLIARDLGLSKNTVMAIVHRHRAANVPSLSA
jgi:DNA-directed RNA polymerase specialized sigma24 family protein